jgi:hypothetical protein
LHKHKQVQFAPTWRLIIACTEHLSFLTLWEDAQGETATKLDRISLDSTCCSFS